MSYTWQETTFTALSTLIAEVIESDAFVQRKGDESPFILAMPVLFAGSPDLRLFVIVDENDNPVAFASTLPDDDLEALSIGPLYVTPAARGKGLGHRLVEDCIGWARARGKTRVSVETWGKNSAARRTFEGAGLSLAAEELNTRIDGDSTVRYQLDLNRA